MTLERTNLVAIIWQVTAMKTKVRSLWTHYQYIDITNTHDVI